MSDTIRLDTFPSDRTEALTMLYLQNQDLSSLSPEELAHKYQEVKKIISKEFRSKAKIGTWI